MEAALLLLESHGSWDSAEERIRRTVGAIEGGIFPIGMLLVVRVRELVALLVVRRRPAGGRRHQRRPRGRHCGSSRRRGRYTVSSVYQRWASLAALAVSIAPMGAAQACIPPRKEPAVVANLHLGVGVDRKDSMNIVWQELVVAMWARRRGQAGVVGHKHATERLCLLGRGRNDGRVDVHASVTRRVRLSAFRRELGPEDGNQRTGDVVAEGRAHSLCAGEGHPVAYQSASASTCQPDLGMGMLVKGAREGYLELRWIRQ